MLDRLARTRRPTGRSATRPTAASRSSSCSPTSATTSATTRTRSPPRPTSARPAGASRCAATRACSTTACTRAATRAPGSPSTSTPAAAPTGRPLDAGSVLPLERRCRRRRPCAGGPARARCWPRAPIGLRDDVRDHASRRAQRRSSFYTWSDDECCLPKGATRATLRDDPTLDLAVGDIVLVFEEIREPDHRQLEADADPTHRHAVRLTLAEPDVDELDGTPVLEIGWADDDALPFPLCVSARRAARRQDGDRGRARQRRARRPRALDRDRGARPAEVPADVPTGPFSRAGPLTFAGRLRPVGGSGSGDGHRPARRAARRRRHGRGRDLGPAARPARAATASPPSSWSRSSRTAIAHLRFGDDERGAVRGGLPVRRDVPRRERPPGNVGAETIITVVAAVPRRPPGPEPAGGDGRRRPRAARAGPAVRAAGVPDPGAGRDRGRLRGGRRARLAGVQRAAAHASAGPEAGTRSSSRSTAPGHAADPTFERQPRPVPRPLPDGGTGHRARARR